MLDSLSFLHSSPPVFSSANTVYPSFLYFMKIRERQENDGKLGIRQEILISQSDYLFSKFSDRVQIKTHALPFCLILFSLRELAEFCSRSASAFL